jgi:hypothetical protein
VASLAAPTLERRQRLVRLAESSKEVDSGPIVQPPRKPPLAMWLGIAAGLLVTLGTGLAWRLSHREPLASAPTVTDAGSGAVAATVLETAPKPEPIEPPVKRVAAPVHASKRSKKDCTPNFWIDKNGHKQFKPECF